MKQSVIATCWLLAVQLRALGAAPGTIDPCFASPLRDIQFILLQTDGHLFVAGRFGVPGLGTNLVRLTADGAHDPTFAPTAVTGPAAMALQPDGKLLQGYQYSGVRRFLPDGITDSSFKFVPPDIHPRIFGFWTTALAVQPDGKILVGGYRTFISSSDDAYWVAPQVYRLLPDGSLDPAFTLFPATVRALGVLPDERILVVSADLTLLHPDGTRDTNFAAGPFSPRVDSPQLNTEYGILATTLNCFALQPDGRILVGGSFTNVQGHARSRLARVLPNGQLDPSFDPPSYTGDGRPEPEIKALAVQADGRILVGGVLRADQWPGLRSLVRLNPDGSLDDTFSHISEGFDDDEDLLGSVSSIVIQDGTRAVIGGSDLDLVDLFRIYLDEHGDEFRIISFRVSPTSLTLSWRSEPGRTYSIESKLTLTNADWTPGSDAIIAQGTQATWTGPRPSDTSAFYRVVRLGD